MPKAICIQCGREFSSQDMFSKHLDSGHTYMGDSYSVVDPTVPNVPQGSLPDKDFLETVARIENKGKAEDFPGIPKVEMPSQTTTQPIPAEKKPLRLEYVFTGECPEHGVRVDTIELDVDKKYFCVAICPVDKKQLLTKEVANLNI